MFVLKGVGFPRIVFKKQIKKRPLVKNKISKEGNKE
jgi:hypothetical protein